MNMFIYTITCLHTCAPLKKSYHTDFHLDKEPWLAVAVGLEGVWGGWKL